MDSFNEPLNEQQHPPIIKAADGKTTLRRYRVEAVVYAENRRDAEAKLDPSSIGMYLEAAALKDEGPWT
jgi:hypothetical protein